MTQGDIKATLALATRIVATRQNCVPQPVIADSKTARMMIRNWALRRAEDNGMTACISCCVGVTTTVNNQPSHFDAKKPICFREADYVPTDYRPRRACRLA